MAARPSPRSSPPKASPTPGTLWVWGKSGVWRQQNGTWSRVADGAPIVIGVNPKRPGEAVWVDEQGAIHRNLN